MKLWNQIDKFFKKWGHLIIVVLVTIIVAYLAGNNIANGIIRINNNNLKTNSFEGFVDGESNESELRNALQDDRVYDETASTPTEPVVSAETDFEMNDNNIETEPIGQSPTTPEFEEEIMADNNFAAVTGEEMVTADPAHVFTAEYLAESQRHKDKGFPGANKVKRVMRGVKKLPKMSPGHDAYLIPENGKRNMLMRPEAGDVSGDTSIFKDPANMTDLEKEWYKSVYRPGTLQDYVNWLKLHYDDWKTLPEPHPRNYRKLMMTGRLSLRDMPKRSFNPPPVSKSDYFKQIYQNADYNQRGTFVLEKMPALEKSSNEHALGPYRGYNYADFNEYIPPEGVEFDVVTDLPEKRDPFELNYYLRPRATVGGERTIAGRIIHKAGQAVAGRAELYHKLDDPRTYLGGGRREVVVTDNYSPGDSNDQVGF